MERIPAVTIRIRSIIGALLKLGVIARHNFLCCQSCGVAELNRIMIEKILLGEEVKVTGLLIL